MATRSLSPTLARPTQPLRLGVVVVDPLLTARAGIALLIGAQRDMEVLAQASTADEGMQTVRRLRRRSRVVVVVSLSLGGEHDAYWLIRQIRERCPTYAIVGTGVGPARMTISRALFVGADGYVDAAAEPRAFLDGLRDVSEGRVALAGLPAGYLGQVAEDIELCGEEPTLTEREREVLSVAAEGLTARQIGTRLGLAERTVTTHLANIYAKLGVAGRVEAITEAARAGLVSVGWVAD
ncbi:MAG: LuxR C-terminal-related transcriptional regulator [Actinomycetota bacterium]